MNNSKFDVWAWIKEGHICGVRIGDSFLDVIKALGSPISFGAWQDGVPKKLGYINVEAFFEGSSLDSARLTLVVYRPQSERLYTNSFFANSLHHPAEFSRKTATSSQIHSGMDFARFEELLTENNVSVKKYKMNNILYFYDVGHNIRAVFSEIQLAESNYNKSVFALYSLEWDLHPMESRIRICAEI